MNQLALDIRTPASRNSDGGGSIDAEALQNLMGKRARDCATVLLAFCRHPMTTTKELAALEGLDRHMVGRRAPDLWSTWLQRAARKEPGQREFRWYPTEAGKAMAERLKAKMGEGI